ncbi:MAG: YIP1 family protein [bacterium]
MSDVDDSIAAVPPPKGASKWEDYIDIFYAPSDVYARRINSGFGIPLLVVTVLVGAIFIASSGALQPIMDAEFMRGMASAQKANPNMTDAQLQTAKSIGGTFAKIGAFVFMPITIFLTGLALWVVGKFFDAKQTFGAALMVTAYANVIKVVASIVMAVQLLLLDTSSMNGILRLSLGVGRFLDPDTTSPLLIAMLGRVDVFTIWVTILLGIGLSVTGKIPRSKAMVAAAVVWFVGAMPGLLGALRQMGS